MKRGSSAIARQGEGRGGGKRETAKKMVPRRGVPLRGLLGKRSEAL